MKIQDFARRREVQILVLFGAVTLTGYYFWLKKKKDALKWASASGTNKLLTEPTEVTACKKACAGSSDPVSCMGQCLNKAVGTL